MRTDGKMAIFKAIDAYVAADLKRWHTPGHKGALNGRDITEIGADGSLFPAEELVAAQEEAAAFYRADACRFLVCGSSMGIKAAVMSAGGGVLAVRGRHRCADEGAALARVNVADLDNTFDNGVYLPPTPKQVEEGLRRHPDVAAVLIVSPDYYGRTASLHIADVVRKAGKLLIADSAHGAHFAARPDLFYNNFSDVADFCVMSAHKTMHAFTQSAYLCVNGGNKHGELLRRADENLKLLGTTSPSYLLLEGLQNAVDYARAHADRYDELKAAADAFRKAVVCEKNDDFTRIVVDAAHYGMTGGALYKKLYAAGHSAETFDSRRVVFIVTLADSPREIQALQDSVLRAIHEG